MLLLPTGIGHVSAIIVGGGGGWVAHIDRGSNAAGGGGEVRYVDSFPENVTSITITVGNAGSAGFDDYSEVATAGEATTITSDGVSATAQPGLGGIIDPVTGGTSGSGLTGRHTEDTFGGPAGGGGALAASTSASGGAGYMSFAAIPGGVVDPAIWPEETFSAVFNPDGVGVGGSATNLPNTESLDANQYGHGGNVIVDDHMSQDAVAGAAVIRFSPDGLASLAATGPAQFTGFSALAGGMAAMGMVALLTRRRIR
ncbi:MAG: hypothetical protein ACOYBP_04020 [Microbacteriaceae bacterium]